MSSFLESIKAKRIEIISVSIFLIFWQIGSRSDFLPVDYVGTPTSILVQFFYLFQLKTFSQYIFPSLLALALGWVFASTMGVIIGFAMGQSVTLKRILKPFLLAINSVPAIVFAPLLLISLGIGIIPVILTILLMSFVPITINVIEGVERTSPNLLGMAKSFGGNRFFQLRNVTFPSTLPYIFAGLKSSVGRAIIALIIAEIYGLNQGIGYLITYYGATYQADKLFALILLVMLISVILFSVIGWLENISNPNKEKNGNAKY